jgi:hypothetical protein
MTAIRNMQIINKYHTYERLLNRATTAYQTLVDLGQWGPSSSIRDRTGAPETMYTKVEVNALAQKMVSRFKKQSNEVSRQAAPARKMVCYNCGKEGHRKAECRSAPKANTGSYNNTSNRNYKSSGYTGGTPTAVRVIGKRDHLGAAILNPNT